MNPDRGDLLALVRDAQENSQETNRALIGQFAGLRWELRIMVAVLVALFAARDGVFTRIGLPGVTIQTASAAGNVSTPPPSSGGGPRP